MPDPRDRIIDAAEECLLRLGATKMTLEDVATAAGVHRATVYRYFDGGRDAVLAAVVIRECGRFVDLISRRVAGQPSLPDAIAEGILYTVEATPKLPTLALLFAPETAGRTSALAATSQPMLALCRGLWEPFVVAAQARGEARADLDLDDLAELVVRLVFSLLGDAALQRSRQDTRRFLQAVIRPFVTVTAGPPPEPPAEQLRAELADSLSRHGELVRQAVVLLGARS